MTKKQTRSPRYTTPEFVEALRGAFSEAERGVPAHLRRYPDPWCLDRPEEYVDYSVIPSKDEAEDMCIDCPLMQLCLASARRTRPAWGVQGGVAWVQGRQAHLMQADDPRLMDLAA